MSEQLNPYAPPRAEIEPIAEAAETGDLRAEPRRVPAGNGARWIGDGWRLFRFRAGLWIGMLLVFGMMFMAAGFIPLVGSLLAWWLFPLLLAGWMIGCHRVFTEEDLRFEDLFAGFNQHFKPLSIAGLIYLAANLVILVAVIIVFGGGMAMIAFGGLDESSLGFMGTGFLLAMLIFLGLMIPVLMAIWFAPALIALNRVAPVDAMKLSFAGCLRNVLPFLVYGLVSMALLLAPAIPIVMGMFGGSLFFVLFGMATFFLGWLVVYPALMCAVYAAYQDIFIEE